MGVINYWIIQSCFTFSVIVHIIIANLGEINTLGQTLKTAFNKVNIMIYTNSCKLVC